jgi:hypothetical protein
MYEENMENDEETQSVSRTYDTHLLMGHFNELDDSPIEAVSKNISDAENILSEAKSKKGIDKILLQIDALKLYASALTLNDKCSIEDMEGLFCFVCIRYPSMEFDWTTLQKIILTSIHKNVDYQVQKTLELAIALYISAIKKELKVV